MHTDRTWLTAWVLGASILTLLLVGCSTSKANVSPASATATTGLGASQGPPGVSTEATQTADAIAVATSKGYADCGTSLYDGFAPHLHVLVCAARGASSTNQLAFFFADSTYVGTDTSGPSAHISATWRNDNTVALLYVLYRPSDPMCCPTGGGAIVRYHWDGSRLQPLDPIPTDRIDAPLSRR